MTSAPTARALVLTGVAFCPRPHSPITTTLQARLMTGNAPLRYHSSLAISEALLGFFAWQIRPAIHPRQTALDPIMSFRPDRLRMVERSHGEA
jgi:hypothetical protein